MKIDVAKIRRLNEELIEKSCSDYYNRKPRFEDTSIRVNEIVTDPIQKFLDSGIIIGDFQGSFAPEEEGEKTVHFFEPDYSLYGGAITLLQLESEFSIRRLSPVGITTFSACSDYLKEVFEEQGRGFATYMNLGDCFYLARLAETYDHRGALGLYVKNAPDWAKLYFGQVFAGIRCA